jgi:rRNA maturation endonuclease Nob1
MDSKLFKKTYRYICDSCKEFTHTLSEYCEKCGEKDSLRNATKEDYKKYKNK